MARLLIACGVAVPVAAQTSPSSARGKTVTLQDLESLAGVGDLSISADGSWLAFRERGTLWVLSSAPNSTPRRLGPGGAPAWAPSRAALAYVARPEGSDEFQIFTYDVRTAQDTQVTRRPGGVEVAKVDWSRNDQLVFTASVPLQDTSAVDSILVPEPASIEAGTPLVLHDQSPDGYALAGLVTGVAPLPSRRPTAVAEVFVHDLRSGETRQLTRAGEGFHSPAWSPDGRAIVSGSRRAMGDNVMRSGLYLIDPATGTVSVLVPAGATDKSSPMWSHDGRRVAYVFHSFTESDAHGVGLIEVERDLDRARSEPIVVQAGLVEEIAWAPDGRGLLSAAIEGVAKPLMELDLATGARTTIGSAQHVVVGTIAVSQSGTVAWVEGNGGTPAVIMVRRPGTTEAEAIHDANPQIRDWALGSQEIVHWINRHGHDRYGVLIKPAGYQAGRRYPLVVSAYTQTTHLNGFQRAAHAGFANQAYASRGYMVFFPGPRLPWTYGSLATSEEEAALIRGADGWDLTVDDVESGVDLLIERGLVDPDRMAVVGFSNGGAVATILLTRTTRYRAIVAVAPANINWVQAALFEDNHAGRWIPTATFTGIGRELSEDPAAYVRGSPVVHLRNARTPTLLAVGDRDDPSFTIPTAELYLGLRRMGQDVTFLRYAGQGHGFFGPAGSDLAERVMRFVDEHLGM